MTRQECEQSIIEKLQEIRELVSEYDPKLEQVNMCITSTQMWAFSFRDFNRSKKDMALNVTKFYEEVSA